MMEIKEVNDLSFILDMLFPSRVKKRIIDSKAKQFDLDKKRNLITESTLVKCYCGNNIKIMVAKDGTIMTNPINCNKCGKEL